MKTKKGSHFCTEHFFIIRLLSFLRTHEWFTYSAVCMHLAPLIIVELILPPYLWSISECGLQRCCRRRTKTRWGWQWTWWTLLLVETSKKGTRSFKTIHLMTMYMDGVNFAWQRGVMNKWCIINDLKGNMKIIQTPLEMLLLSLSVWVNYLPITFDWQTRLYSFMIIGDRAWSALFLLVSRYCYSLT